MISLCLNLDTRDGFDQDHSQMDSMGRGVRSVDFFTVGIENRLKFLSNLGVAREEIELNLFVDLHQDIPKDILSKIRQEYRPENLILHKHKETMNGGAYDGHWLDMCFLHSMVVSREEYIMRFDGDTYAFAPEESDMLIQWKQWIDEDRFRFISYPSAWSPKPVDDPRFGDYWWASTRFFFCKRSAVDYSECVRCMYDPEYMWAKYGRKKQELPWLEHVLGIHAQGADRVYYPSIQHDKCLIFSWHSYRRGLLGHLNMLPYSGVVEFVQNAGGINYPCDVAG